MASRLPYQPLPLQAAAGHVLQRQHDDTSALWEIASGAFAERILDTEGRVLVLDIAGPGDVTGSPPGSPAPWEVRALCPASYRIWSGPVDPAAARWADRLGSLANELAWMHVTDRVLNRLESLAARFGVAAPGGVRIGLSLTHEDLAASVGASRESVSRAMSELRASGRIKTRGRGGSWWRRRCTS
jgi:CRP-like cAMP-binding protein